jgi:hypothetical protein
MQNISAVLDEIGEPWIIGYKPLPHYQRSLRDVVLLTLRVDHRIGEAVTEYVTSPVPAPMREQLSTDDVLVEPPSIASRTRRGEINVTSGPTGAMRDFHNRKLGTAGEEWVLRLEREGLRRAGRSDLADRVEWTSQDRGDGFGYDIASFRLDGSVTHIEVKTTNLARRTPFFVTRWEVETSEREPGLYSLFRVFDFRSEPRIYRLNGSITESSRLEPAVFVGVPRSA